MNHKVSEGRKRYIDILRIIVCLLVIYNHTGPRGFYRFFESEHTVKIVCELFLAVVTKVAVPIFFMISGVLLLKKEESIKATYLRIPKIVIGLIFFSVVYLGIDLSGGILPMQISTLLMAIFIFNMGVIVIHFKFAYL